MPLELNTPIIVTDVNEKLTIEKLFNEMLECNHAAALAEKRAVRAHHNLFDAARAIKAELKDYNFSVDVDKEENEISFIPHFSLKDSEEYSEKRAMRELRRKAKEESEKKNPEAP